MGTTSRNHFKDLTELLARAGVIQPSQKDLLDKVFALSTVYYADGTEREEKLREFVTTLTEASLQYIENGERGVSEKLGKDLQERAKLLNAPQFSEKDLGLNEPCLTQVAGLFFCVGTLTRLSRKKVSPVDTFAMFPHTICRLIHPALVSLSKAKLSVSQQFAAITTALQASVSTPRQALKQILGLAGSIGRQLLTDLHAGGPISIDNIYELGPTMYRDEAHSLFVFSRTSGLIIPSEYYGDADNNPYRRIYFDEGILGDSGRNLKIYYQWNQPTTAIRLFEGFAAAERVGAGDKYKTNAADILSKFFRHRNIQISEAVFGHQRPQVGNLKRSMTIVNRSSVVKSSRDPYTRSINGAVVLGGYHSDNHLAALLTKLTPYQVEPRWSSQFDIESPVQSRCSIHFAVKTLYDEDVILTVKRLGQILDIQAAREHVDRLIALGRERVRKQC